MRDVNEDHQHHKNIKKPYQHILFFFHKNGEKWLGFNSDAVCCLIKNFPGMEFLNHKGSKAQRSALVFTS